MSVDLETLEYPRHLHKTHADFLVVHSAEEAAKAIEDGWTVDCPAPVYDDAPAPVVSRAVDPLIDAVDEPIDPVPVPAHRPKRGRSKHAEG